MHVQLCMYVYACASVHLESLECMGTRICGWGCLVHVIRAYVHICIHSICHTLSTKVAKASLGLCAKNGEHM